MTPNPRATPLKRNSPPEDLQIIWNTNMPYRALEWGYAFQMNVKSLHREHPIIDYQVLIATKCSR